MSIYKLSRYSKILLKICRRRTMVMTVTPKVEAKYLVQPEE